MAATRRGGAALPCRCGCSPVPQGRSLPARRRRRRSGRDGGVALLFAAAAVAVTAAATAVVGVPTAPSAAPSVPPPLAPATAAPDADLPPVTTAFRGHLFGSPTAHDAAVAMGLDPAGHLYLAGTTAPHGGGGTPWGTRLPGYTGGGADLWVAKLSPAAALLWVRRAGSAAGEAAAALAVGRTGVVVCGSTGGRMRAEGGRVVGAGVGGGAAADGGGGGRIAGADGGGGRVAGADGGGGRISGADARGGRISGAVEDGPVTGAVESGATPTGGNAVGGADGGSLPTLPEMLAAATVGGAASPAAPDAVLLKLAPDGTEAWASALQFGGPAADDCRAVAMDADAGWVWAAGSTSSMLFSRTAGAAALGASPPPAGRSDWWVAKAAASGVLPELVAGVQRGAERANSADAVALAGDRLYVNAYVGGFAGDAATGRGTYTVAKYDADGGWAWARPYGRYSRVAPSVALAADPAGGVVYVGGLADGFYANAAHGAGGGGSATRGCVVAPLLGLNATTGEPWRRWQKTSAIPGDDERTAAVAVDAHGAVVYAGSRLAAAGGAAAGMRKALLGAVGSAAYATRLSGGLASAAVAGGAGGGAVHVETSTGADDEPPATMPITAVVGMVAGVMGGAVVLVGAMVMGVKRRQVAAGAASVAGGEGTGAASVEAGGGEAARVQALAAMEAVLPYPGAALAGGSAGPV